MTQEGDDERSLPRERALRVQWSTGDEPGALLYGLRRPDQTPDVDVCSGWPTGTECRDPWLLHGPGWAVDLWTIRLQRLPTGDEWIGLLRNTLKKLIDAGYAAAWFAPEADFADPPYLFDSDYMGDRVYAVHVPELGFLTRDDGDARQLRVLPEHDIARIRSALPAWATEAQEE